MNTTFSEIPSRFECQNETLVGILHKASTSHEGDTGVLIIVGGPQYRAGSHRQFLIVARALAKSGFPCFRFDYRGMGDASGRLRIFDEVDSDIEAAIGEFTRLVPSVKKIVIWALCDGASAGIFYAHKDPRIVGLVILNPWVRTESGEAKSLVTHYYAKRFLQKEFWRKLASGNLNVMRSIKSFAKNLRLAHGNQDAAPEAGGLPLPDRMANDFRQFNGPTLVILSEDDLTACEFEDVTRNHPQWRQLLGRANVELKKIPGANHTFSKVEWRTQVEQWTIDWLKRSY